MKASPKHQPSAQVEPAKRAAALKVSNEAKRLLTKSEVCKVANASFQSIWAWMRAGTFPRSRIVGGRSMWLSTEVEQWLATLPIRPLKGDATEADQHDAA